MHLQTIINAAKRWQTAQITRLIPSRKSISLPEAAITMLVFPLSCSLRNDRNGVLTFSSCHSRPLSSRASQPTAASFYRIRFQPQTNGYVRNNPIFDIAFCDRLFYSHNREPMAKTDSSASGKTSPTPNWPLRFSASTFRDPKSPQTTSKPSSIEAIRPFARKMSHRWCIWRTTYTCLSCSTVQATPSKTVCSTNRIG